MPNTNSAKPKPPLYKGAGIYALLAGSALLISILVKIVIGDKDYWAEACLFGTGWAAGIVLSVLMSNVIARFTGLSLPVLKYGYYPGFIYIYTETEMEHYGLKKAPFSSSVISAFLSICISGFIGYLFVTHLFF